MGRRSRGLGRYLSYVLRHNPEELGLELRPGGWVSMEALLTALQIRRRDLTRADIELVVSEDEKRRFSTSVVPGVGELIRANQGHSVQVDLQLDRREPPSLLWHGTTAAAAASIRTQGILKMGRHHVHMSSDPETARRVTRRLAEPVVLRVRAGEAALAGVAFYVSDNGVWLAEFIPPEYVEVDGAGS